MLNTTVISILIAISSIFTSSFVDIRRQTYYKGGEVVSNPGQVVKPRTTQHYETKGGSCPFEKWFDSLTIKGQTKVAARLTSVRSGNLGVTKGVGEGVKEMKFNPKGHPTYRIYYGEDGDTLVILLCGGDKSDQSRDINKAKEYWDDYKSRK